MVVFEDVTATIDFHVVTDYKFKAQKYKYNVYYTELNKI